MRILKKENKIVLLSKEGGIYVGFSFFGFNFNEGTPIKFIPLSFCFNWCGLKYYISYKNIFTGKWFTKYVTKKILI